MLCQERKAQHYSTLRRLVVPILIYEACVRLQPMLQTLMLTSALTLAQPKHAGLMHAKATRPRRLLLVRAIIRA